METSDEPRRTRSEEVVGMCHRPTQEEITRSDAIRAASFASEEEHGRPDGHSRDPWVYPEPRGNGSYDRREAERSEEKLAAVLGH